MQIFAFHGVILELNEVLGFILDRWPEKIKPRDNYLVETQAEILKNLTQLEKP